MVSNRIPPRLWTTRLRIDHRNSSLDERLNSMNLREYLIAGVVVIAIAAGAYQWIGERLLATIQQTFNLP